MFLGREIMASDIAGKLGVDKGEMRRETLEILRDLGIDSKSCDAPTPEAHFMARATAIV